MGRHAIFHILKAHKIRGPILVPVYLCQSAIEALALLNIEAIFYDIDLQDLNASVSSIILLSKKNKCEAVLVASMYGNPADLINIEKFCARSGIKLIDDAAQSFGASLEGRFVGTFGNAGLFSFAPGKPTAGHIGAFFWSDSKVEIERTKNDFCHLLAYLDFKFNRLNKSWFGLIVAPLKRIFMRLIDISNDDISVFEKKILGGIMWELLEGKYSYRKMWTNEFYLKFSNNSYFRIIKSARGEASPHKLVVVCNDRPTAISMINHLKKNGVYVLNGYMPLTTNLNNLPNMEEINGCIVEMPIEDSSHKMEYLFDLIHNFIKQ